MQTSTAIDVRALVRDFGDLRALDDVSFTVRPGQVIALLGHNGAGKTTFLRVLTGLLRPTSGSVSTLGHDPIRHGRVVRSRTGVLTEYPALDDFLTVSENLRAYGAMHGLSRATIDRRSTSMLDALDLADRRDTAARDLSAGLKQRAALARAMLHDPDLLLLDEPTSNLDPLAARMVRRLVADRSRNHGTTVVVSTHNLAEAGAIADRVVVLERGRVLAHGSVEELAADVQSSHVAITTTPATHELAADVATRLCGKVDLDRRPHTFTASTHRVTTGHLVRALVEAGVDVTAVVPGAASLEDVYVALHSDRPGTARRRTTRPAPSGRSRA